MPAPDDHARRARRGRGRARRGALRRRLVSRLKALREQLERLEDERLEQSDLAAALVRTAREHVQLDPEELRGALRRAALLAAAGGDPHRGLRLDSRPVTALAEELGSPEPRGELLRELERLTEASEGLPDVSATVAALREEAELAWRLLALTLLADELA